MNDIVGNTAINDVSIEPRPQAPMHPPPELYGNLSQLEKKMETTAISHIWKLNYILLGFDFCMPLITIFCGFVFILFQGNNLDKFEPPSNTLQIADDWSQRPLIDLKV